MIEVIVMVSPFAFYWYAVYTPTLQGLHRWRGTAWLEAFFLPHSVVTTSSLLEFLRWQVGTYCFSVGVIGFLICAGQIYRSKLLGRGIVRSWIYSSVRHPQYSCLAIAGFGLLTMWPRMIILALYIGMLLMYFFLATFEENRMLVEHPDYSIYRQRTGMFFPGNPGAALFRAFFDWIPNRTVALATASAVVVVLVMGSSLFLRQYTIRHAAMRSLPEDRTLAIAIWPMPDDAIQQIVAASIENNQVRSALNKEAGAVFTAHILPADYSMVDMFADVGVDHRMLAQVSPHFFRHLGGLVLPFLRHHHRNRVMGTPQGSYQVIFSRVDGPDQKPVPFSRITGLESKMTPVAVAEVDRNRPTVRRVTFPPRRSLWGDITMPMF